MMTTNEVSIQISFNAKVDARLAFSKYREYLIKSWLECFEASLASDIWAERIQSVNNTELEILGEQNY